MKQWHAINKIAKWIVNILVLNLYWYLFTILGFVIFGFFPATAAMFAIMRKWIYEKEKDLNIFKVFKEYYKKDFFELNLIAILYYLAILIVFILSYFLEYSTSTFILLFSIILIISVPLITSLLYFFPIFVHYKLKGVEYIKQSFLVAISSPRELFAMFITFILIIFLTYLLPGISLFFNGVISAFTFVYFSNMSFEKI